VILNGMYDQGSIEEPEERILNISMMLKSKS
jgi:hypothetical protein